MRSWYMMTETARLGSLSLGRGTLLWVVWETWIWTSETDLTVNRTTIDFSLAKHLYEQLHPDSDSDRNCRVVEKETEQEPTILEWRKNPTFLNPDCPPLTICWHANGSSSGTDTQSDAVLNRKATRWWVMGDGWGEWSDHGEAKVTRWRTTIKWFIILRILKVFTRFLFTKGHSRWVNLPLQNEWL